MILTVVKAQIIVEGFMTSLLDAHGRDPKHFFFTAPKIKECKRIDPPEVGQTMWDLLSLCTYEGIHLFSPMASVRSIE